MGDEQHYCRSGTFEGRTGTMLAIRVQPRSSRSGPMGAYGSGELKWGIHAAPVDGQANDELLRSVAEKLKIARQKVILIRGQRSRSKVLFLDGVESAGVLRVIEL